MSFIRKRVPALLKLLECQPIGLKMKQVCPERKTIWRSASALSWAMAAANITNRRNWCYRFYNSARKKWILGTAQQRWSEVKDPGMRLSQRNVLSCRGKRFASTKKDKVQLAVWRSGHDGWPGQSKLTGQVASRKLSALDRWQGPWTSY